MDPAHVAKDHRITQWNALCAQHVFPFASHTSAESLDIIKQHINHDPNAEVTLPVQHPRYISIPSNIPLVAALMWHPELVEHCLNQGAVVPQNSHQWHHNLVDVWVFGTKNKSASDVQNVAGVFSRSLQLLHNAGYYFAEYKEAKSTNDRNRRLSFLHTMLWRAEETAYPEILFCECVKNDIPVSDDFLGDIKYRSDKFPNLCDQVQNYVLSEVARQSAKNTPLKRVSKM